MIYVIIGGSCAGKTSFVRNSFLNGKQFKEYKDIVTICETDDAFLIGVYDTELRCAGTDKIWYGHIRLITDQVEKLYQSGKDIVIEGTRILTSELFQKLAKYGKNVKLILLRVSVRESVRRNRENGSEVNEGTLKGAITRAENLFSAYQYIFDSEIYETDNVSDFSELKLGCGCTPIEGGGKEKYAA